MVVMFSKLVMVMLLVLAIVSKEILRDRLWSAIF